MKHGAELIGIGLAASLTLAGCSTAGGEAPNTTTALSASTPGETSPSTPSPTTSPLGAEAMKVSYVMTQDADPRIAQSQISVGNMAVAAVIGKPIELTVDGQPITVSVQVPEDMTARKQVVVFTANSKNVGKVFGEIGVHDDSIVSTTKYSLKKDVDGNLSMTGPSASVVGQETEGVGLFTNIATERCQGLELKGALTTDPSIYAVDKEAICNSLGVAADAKMLDYGYEDYLARIKGQKLDEKVGRGHLLYYPVLPREVFDDLQQAPNPVKTA